MTEKQKRIINISIRDVHLWAITIVAFLTIGGLVFASVFSVRDTYTQVTDNKEIIVNHEDRLSRIELTMNEFDTSIENIKELKNEIVEFRKELRQIQQEWMRLFRDFELQKK